VQDTTSPAPAGKIHHEDIEVGKRITVGNKLLTKEEIIAFGRAFDPQPMHVDEEAAKATLVGGLCASGWHTCAIMMRLLCDGLIGRMAGLGSPGVDEVRWRKPVRPGDVLSVRYTAQEKRMLASRPDVGVSKVLVELVGASLDAPRHFRRGTSQAGRANVIELRVQLDHLSGLPVAMLVIAGLRSAHRRERQRLLDEFIARLDESGGEMRLGRRRCAA